jgi:hypothetical protein
MPHMALQHTSAHTATQHTPYLGSCTYAPLWCRCREPKQPGCCQHGSCRYGFPYKVQPAVAPQHNSSTNRYDYYRPTDDDRNVVPYHPTVLLLWGAHMNLQLVTDSQWSYYLLK